MAPLKHGFVAMVAIFALSGVCRAGVSAVLLIYQPIITSGEATVIETPKGFAILGIPFECFHYHGRPPFYAIAQPNLILTDAPRSALASDSNLVSSAGVTIGSSIDDDMVHVHFESLHSPAALDVTVDDIAEATLECIRRTAEGATARPKVRITGKKGDEEKWKRWQDSFEKHDLTKPFIRPNA
jgi:hypothetical protein